MLFASLRLHLRVLDPAPLAAPLVYLRLLNLPHAHTSHHIFRGGEGPAAPAATMGTTPHARLEHIGPTGLVHAARPPRNATAHRVLGRA